MRRLTFLLHRISAFGIVLLSAYFIFQSPKAYQIIVMAVLASIYVLTGTQRFQSYLLISLIVPLLGGLFLPLKQLNRYPSVAVFYVSLIWTTVFILLFLFLGEKILKKNGGKNEHKKNQ